MKGCNASKSARKKASKRNKKAGAKSSRTRKTQKSDPLASKNGSAKNTKVAKEDSARDGKKRKEQKQEEDVEKKKSEANMPTIVEINTQEDVIEHEGILLEDLQNFMRSLKRFRIPRKPLAPLSEKDRLLMDRVHKKPYPVRYIMRSHDPLLAEEASSFFRPSAVKKKQSGSIITYEDTYEHVRHWDAIRQLPEETVLTEMGIPFWREQTEPTEDDTKDVSEAIMVGADHIEMYHNKQFTLKCIKERVILDESQTLVELAKRDAVHFDTPLVFSNTLRSLINVQLPKSEKSTNPMSHNEKKVKPACFDVTNTRYFAYSRQKPIESARELLSKEKREKTRKTKTTKTTITTEGTLSRRVRDLKALTLTTFLTS